MKIKSHLKLARLALLQSDISFTNKLSIPFFYLGTILADMSWLPKTHSHYANKSLDYILMKIDKLKACSLTPYHAMQLGIVVHYLCDFCCLAHQGNSVGNLISHVQYELKLQGELTKQFKILKKRIKQSKTPKASLIPHFSHSFIKYQLYCYKHKEASIEKDIIMALMLSSEICHMLLELNQNRRALLKGTSIFV